MASLNLSFKEWPYLSPSQIPHSQLGGSPPFITQTIELLKSKILSNISTKSDHDSSSDSSDVDSSQISTNSQADNDNPSITKTTSNNQTITSTFYHVSSWGRCGLFACTFNSCLSIFSNDENGVLTPIFMFSPFEQFIIGRLNKQNLRNISISAIAWANGNLQPTISKPILAVASEKGHLAIYDFSSKKIIGNLHLNEPITSLLWSSYKINRLYIGTSAGHLYICELNRKNVQTIKTFVFYSYLANSSESFPKSVDFISQDDVDGLTIAIASKDGTVGYITNIDDTKQAKLQVFQQLPFNGENTKSNDTMNFFDFYPNSQDFIIIATNSSTFLISISKGVLIPFIQTPNCKFIQLLENSSDQVLVGYDNEIAVWKLVDPYWVRSSVANFGGKFGLTEILTFSKLTNDRVLLTNASNWLTEVVHRNGKVFVTRRVRLINGVPIDYDFGNGSIALLTNDNTVSFTLETPEAIIKPKIAVDKSRPDDNLNNNNNNNNNDGSLLSFQNDEDSNTEDYIDINLLRSNSLTFEVGADASQQLNQSIDAFDNNDLLLKSTSEIISNNSTFKEFKDFISEQRINSENESLLGNSNSIVLSFNINVNDETGPIKNIEWITNEKVVAWSKNSIYSIDIQNREIKEPLKKRYDKKCNTITQVFFSKSRKIMCVIFNNKTVYIVNTQLNDFSFINTVDFSTVINNDDDCLLGSLSPQEDQIVLAHQNYLYFARLDSTGGPLNMTKINSNLDYIPSFLLWKNRGLIIGTEKGSVFIVSSKKLDDIYNSNEIRKRDIAITYDSARGGKKKLGPIKQVTPSVNNTYIIIDTLEQGIVVSSNNLKIIADNIKSFKQCGKQTFLARITGINKLIAVNTFGEFSPPPPPCFFTTKKNNLCFDPMKFYLLELSKDKNNNNIFGSIVSQLFQSNKDDPSISLRNSFELLNQIISSHAPFNSLSSKTFLKLGKLVEARNVLLNTEPSEKEYFNNLMLATAYDSNKSYSESVQLVVKNLLSNNLIDEAVDLLLITKNIYKAVEIMFKFGRNKDAYMILMLSGYKSSEDENPKELIQKIANSLITKRENPLFGLKLLASFGYTHELINQLSLNLE